MVSVDYPEDMSAATSSSVVSPWSDNTSKDPKSMMPHGTFRDVSSSSSSKLPTLLPMGAAVGGPPSTWVLEFAIGSNVADASTTKTLCVDSALSSTFGTAFCSGRVEADSDFRTVHFSTFTFYEFSTASHVIADLFTQISHHRWSRTTGAAVHDCHKCVPSSVRSPGTGVAGLSIFSQGL